MKKGTFLALIFVACLSCDGPTEPKPDPAPKIVSAVSVSADTATANISWSTDQEADSRVECGAKAGAGSGATKSHLVVLSGLEPGKQFSCAARSQNSNGEAKADFTFATKFPPQATITILSVSADSTSFTVKDSTSRPLAVTTRWGLTCSSFTDSLKETSASLVHSVTVANRAPDTQYCFEVSGTDQWNRLAAKRDSVRTGKLSPPALDSVKVSKVDTTSAALQAFPKGRTLDSLIVRYGSSCTSLTQTLRSAAIGANPIVTISGLVPNTANCAGVSAKDRWGIGSELTKSFRTAARPDPCLMPQPVPSDTAKPAVATISVVFTVAPFSQDQSDKELLLGGIACNGYKFQIESDGETAQVDPLDGRKFNPKPLRPVVVNYPYGSKDHWFRSAIYDYVNRKFVRWLACSEIKLNGVALSRATPDSYPLNVDPDVNPKPGPYCLFKVGADGIVYP